ADDATRLRAGQCRHHRDLRIAQDRPARAGHARKPRRRPRMRTRPHQRQGHHHRKAGFCRPWRRHRGPDLRVADRTLRGGPMTNQELPFAHGVVPPLAARLRVTHEDFLVEEILGYDADGSGEHALLWVEKRGANTDWVARELAKFAGVPPLAVGYAGLKDRHAVTRQAFSVQLAGKPDLDWSVFPHAEVKVLAATRHGRKLKRGARRGASANAPHRCWPRSPRAACRTTSASSVSAAKAATWNRHGRCSRDAG